jgi:MAPEG family
MRLRERLDALPITRRLLYLTVTLGAASWWAALAIASRLWPDVPPLATSGERLVYAAQLIVSVAVLVLLMVGACFRMFDNPGAENPLLGRESEAWKIHQRVLQNTVEQSFIFVPSLLALATRLPAADVRYLPLLTSLWCAGRLMFWIGYRIHPYLRGPGFEWTLCTSVFTLGYYVYLVV